MPLDPDVARSEVLALEAGIYAKPTERHDVAHVLAPEFWEVSEAGEQVTREVVLERLAASPLIVDDYPVDDARVEVYGDVAISTGHSVLHGRWPLDDGSERAVERANRFVHVWVRRDGAWQVVFAQNSGSAES